MPNIPFIPQGRNLSLSQFRRAHSLSQSEQSTSRSPKIKRRLERRQNKDRRQQQTRVLFDRRHKGMARRKNQLNQSISAKSVSLSDTIGKHINTTA